MTPTTKENKDYTLDRDFYNELLYIIGLTETGRTKKLIERYPEKERQSGAILEETMSQIEREIDRLVYALYDLTEEGLGLSVSDIPGTEEVVLEMKGMEAVLRRNEGLQWQPETEKFCTQNFGVTGVSGGVSVTPKSEYRFFRFRPTKGPAKNIFLPGHSRLTLGADN